MRIGVVESYLSINGKHEDQMCFVHPMPSMYMGFFPYICYKTQPFMEVKNTSPMDGMGMDSFDTHRSVFAARTKLMNHIPKSGSLSRGRR